MDSNARFRQTFECYVWTLVTGTGQPFDKFKLRDAYNKRYRVRDIFECCHGYQKISDDADAEDDADADAA